jgi:RNA polymerase sigma factor (sigma-70 family)
MQARTEKERDIEMKDAVQLDSSKRDILYSQIMDALDKMPERLREVFVLKHYEGMSEQVIASRTGIQPMELAAMLWKANSILRRSLLEVHFHCYVQ